MVESVPVTPSPEIEAVMRRILTAYASADRETLSNLFSTDPNLRVIGTDDDEWWIGPDEFLGVLEAQSHDWPDFEAETRKVEAFQDGAFGWATALTVLTSPETTTPLRHVAALRLEAGNWRVIQWHNSIPVPNREIWGVDLTTTLNELVASVLAQETPFVSQAGAEGTMTLVFTDIVDSTGHAQAVGDAAWTQVIAEHESTIREITTSQGGSVVKLLGDGSMLAFASAKAALRAAVEIQRSNAPTQFDTRIGIHTGEVIHTGEDLFGLTVNKAARVAAAADAGGIMISSTTRDLVGSMPGVRMAEPKTVALKGLSGSHQVFPVAWD